MDETLLSHRTAECWLALAEQINEPEFLEALKVLPKTSARSIERLELLQTGE
jgi:hypothetical protein